MLKTFLAILLIVAIAVVLLSVRLFFGKKFVHTDIKGNRVMEERGIKCAVEQEVEQMSKQNSNDK